MLGPPYTILEHGPKGAYREAPAARNPVCLSFSLLRPLVSHWPPGPICPDPPRNPTWHPASALPSQLSTPFLMESHQPRQEPRTRPCLPPAAGSSGWMEPGSSEPQFLVPTHPPGLSPAMLAGVGACMIVRHTSLWFCPLGPSGMEVRVPGAAMKPQPVPGPEGPATTPAHSPCPGPALPVPAPLAGAPWRQCTGT